MKTKLNLVERNENRQRRTHHLPEGRRVRERRRLGAPAALPPEGAATDLLAEAVHEADAPPPPVGRRRLAAAAAAAPGGRGATYDLDGPDSF